MLRGMKTSRIFSHEPKKKKRKDESQPGWSCGLMKRARRWEKPLFVWPLSKVVCSEGTVDMLGEDENREKARPPVALDEKL